MSYWRTIIARFARLLVRIARSLDDLAAGGRLTMAPEHMGRLRQRYPDAPRHWLETLARRTAVEDMPMPPVEQAVTYEAETYEAPQLPDDVAARQPDFAVANRSAMPRVKFNAPVAARPARVVAPATQPQSRRRRAQIVVRAVQETVRSNPIFAIGRRFRLDRNVQFRTDTRDRLPEAATERAVRDSRLESDRHDYPFPPLRHVRTEPDPALPHEAAARQEAPAPQPEPRLSRLRPEPQFPQSFGVATRRDPAWLDGQRPAPNGMAASFAMALSNWPELPALAEESTGRAPASPIDAVRLEQVVGIWNA